MTAEQPSELMLEIGAKLYPRRYHRRRITRTFDQACDWAESLDWRNNPYDFWLLRREVFLHLENHCGESPEKYTFRWATYCEVEEEVNGLLAEYAEDSRGMGVLSFVVVQVPWRVGFRKERIRYSHLSKALATLP